MGSGDRFILFLIALVLGVIGITMAASMLGAMDSLTSLLAYLLDQARWATVAVSAVVVAAGIYLLSLAFKTTQERAIVNETSLGAVKISLRTMESLVLRAANQVRGVREVQPYVNVADGEVKVGLDVTVVPDVCIPDVAAEVQQRVGDYVQSSVGMSVSDVRVNVRGLSSEGKARVE